MGCKSFRIRIETEVKICTWIVHRSRNSTATSVFSGPKEHNIRHLMTRWCLPRRHMPKMSVHYCNSQARLWCFTCSNIRHVAKLIIQQIVDNPASCARVTDVIDPRSHEGRPFLPASRTNYPCKTITSLIGNVIERGLGARVLKGLPPLHLHNYSLRLSICDSILHFLSNTIGGDNVLLASACRLFRLHISKSDPGSHVRA